MKHFVKKILSLTFFVVLSSFTFAEEKLPSGYKNIKFGMTVDEVKSALKKDSSFGYRGDRDVSLLPGTEEVLIETDSRKYASYSFLERCWFQFYEGKLYIITINMKKEKIDHYSVFSTLKNKYGNPDSLNPQKSEWKNEETIMTLERPLTLKWTDRKVFEQIQYESFVEKSIEEKSRDLFLEGL